MNMQSENIGALAAALAKAQGAMKPAAMDRDNYFKMKYATLTSLWESARGALSANELAVTQTTDFDAHGEPVLVTTLLHSSGEWIGGIYPVKAKDNSAQAMGGAITYARRYALGALVGLTADDDDDGNTAQNGTPVVKPAAASKPNGTGGAPANGTTKPDAASVKFHAIGAKLYGQEWETKRHEIVKAATKGRTTSSKDLTPDELAHLTERMDAKLQAQLDGISKANVPEMQPA